MVKCNCGKDCKAKIELDSCSELMQFTDKDEKVTTFYLDANNTINLIKELRRYLNELAEFENSQ